MTSTVAIFRKRLLSYSETFIADQGQRLPHYRPVFCGFHEDRSGLGLIEGAHRVLLDESSRLPALAKFGLRHDLGGAKKWLNSLAGYSPKLIHAHFFNDGLDAINIGNRLDIPVVTTVHGHDITKYENAVAHSKRNRRFFERVGGVIAVSRFIAEQAIAKGCPEHKLLQHYIGIDLERFSQPKRESAEPSLLFVGRLVEKKGCRYLLQAMSKLATKFPQLHLRIIGEGELKKALQQEAGALDLNVEFSGTASAVEIRQALAQCWLFVAPSITAASGDAEGLGMVFLEAQALQTPVVSFRSGGLVEAVEDQVTALLCDEKDVSGLAANIGELLENEQQRHNMGIAGRARVEQYFDLRKQCAKLETIYDKLG